MHCSTCLVYRQLFALYAHQKSRVCGLPFDMHASDENVLAQKQTLAALAAMDCGFEVAPANIHTNN